MHVHLLQKFERKIPAVGAVGAKAQAMNGLSEILIHLRVEERDVLVWTMHGFP